MSILFPTLQRLCQSDSPTPDQEWEAGNFTGNRCSLECALVGSSSKHFSDASETEVQEAAFCAGIGDTNSGGYSGFLKDLGVLVAWSGVIWGMTPRPPTDSGSFLKDN